MSNLRTAYLNKVGNIVTPMGRMVYPSLDKPSGMSGQPVDQHRYNVTLMIPAEADIEVIKKRLSEVKAEKAPNVKNIRSPLLKTEENDRLAGYAPDFPYFIRCRSKQKPEVVNADRTPVAFDGNDVYSGRWARVEIQPFYYDNSGNKGMSFGLLKVQLGKHDERMGPSGASVEDTFDSVDIGDSKPPAATKAEAPADEEW